MAEETQQRKKNNIQEPSNRLEVTCIRLFHDDMEIFRRLPDFKRRLSPTLRKFLHDWIQTNGFGATEIRTQMNKVAAGIRDDQGIYLALAQKLSVQSKKEEMEAMERIEAAKQERTVWDALHEFAKIWYFSQKSPLMAMAQVGGKKPINEAWIESRKKPYLKRPGFPTDNHKIIEEVKQIVQENQELWDGEWELEKKQGHE